jgi:hypothetical protein
MDKAYRIPPSDALGEGGKGNTRTRSRTRCWVEWVGAGDRALPPHARPVETGNGDGQGITPPIFGSGTWIRIVLTGIASISPVLLG